MAEKYVIKPSPVAGKGVFATSTINAGETVRQFTGESYDLLGMLKLVENDAEVGSDPLGVADDEYLDLDETSRTFNHSCDPNCFLRGRSELVAMRDIQPGEELTYDYSTSMADDIAKLKKAGHGKWTCRCRCGSTNCRRIIDQFETLPEDRKRFYVQHGYAPDFILQKFAPLLA